MENKSQFENLAFVNRYRPDDFKTLILLPRIKKIITEENGLNFLFYSKRPGMGKSSLSYILSKDCNVLELNCGSDNGKDILPDIENFCANYGIGANKDKRKVLILTEFEKATSGLQLALRDIIEKNEHILFLFTANDIVKLDEKLKSRITIIDFEPRDEEEVDYLNQRYLSCLKWMCKNENITDLSDDEIQANIDKNFPDFRACVKELQEYNINKDKKSYCILINKQSESLYENIMNGKNNLLENYDLLYSTYKNRSKELLLTLGRPFFLYMKANTCDNLLKIGQMYIDLHRRCSSEYENAVDKEMLVFDYVNKLKQIFVK